ncbi:DLW-39 family protein [uncultured Phycicoccus sp.]|nr:DLW-39 family protein [uncultured Phycicoccus sp.]
MKKLLVLLASAVGALAITKQIKDKQAENRLWAEATDSPRS